MKQILSLFAATLVFSPFAFAGEGSFVKNGDLWFRIISEADATVALVPEY